MQELKSIKTWALAFGIALFMSAMPALTHNEDPAPECERLMPSGKDRLLLITLNADGTRMVEDHPRPRFGMVRN